MSATGGLTDCLDDFGVRSGLSLQPIQDPGALLRPSSNWRISSHIRQAVEDAIQAGINVALVNVPGMRGFVQQHQQQHSHNQHQQRQHERHQHQQHQPHNQQLQSQEQRLVASPQVAVASAAAAQQAGASQAALTTTANTSTTSTSSSSSRTTGSGSSSSSSSSGYGSGGGGAAPMGGPSIAIRYEEGTQRYLLLLQGQQQQQQQQQHQEPAVAGPSAGAAQAAALAERQASHAAASTSSAESPTAAAAAAAHVPHHQQQCDGASVQELDAPLITSLLRGAGDAAAVQQLVEAHWDSLDHIHTSAALVRLAHLHLRARSPDSSRTERWRQQQRAEEKVGGYVVGGKRRHQGVVLEFESAWQQREEKEQEQLRSAARAAAPAPRSVAQQLPSSFFARLMQLAERQLPQMQGRHVSTSLWAVAVLGLRPPEAWLESFARRAEALMPGGTAPQGFSNTIWAMATLGWQPGKAWMRSFYAASAEQLRSFQPQELSSMLWALGTLRARPPGAWSSAALDAAAARLGGFNAQGLSNMVWALGAMRLRPPAAWWAAAGYVVRRRAGEFTPQGMANFLWAYAVLQGQPARHHLYQHHHKHNQHQLQQVQQEQQRKEQGQEQQVGGQPAPAAPLSAPWLSALDEAAAQRLTSYKPDYLANVIWALGVLGHRPSASFRAAAARAVPAQLRRLSGHALSSAVWGMAKMGWDSADAALACALERLGASLASLKPRSLVDVACAVLLLQQQQQQQREGAREELVSVSWRSAYLAHCRERLWEFSASELTDLGAALCPASGLVPDQDWADEYMAAASAQLHDFLPRHFVGVLRALAAWSACGPGRRPLDGWSVTFLAAAVQQLQAPGRWTAAEAAALLPALAAAGVEPEQRQLVAILEATLPAAAAGQGGALGARSAIHWRGPSALGAAAAVEQEEAQAALAAAAVAWQGLVALGFHPPSWWLRRFYGSTQPLLLSHAAIDAAAREAAAMLLSMARLGVKPISSPARKWAAAAYAACSGCGSGAASAAKPAALPGMAPRLGRLPAGAAARSPLAPQHAAQVLWAAAMLKRPPSQRRHLVALVASAEAGLGACLTLQQAAAALWGAASMDAFESAPPALEPGAAAAAGEAEAEVGAWEAADPGPWLAAVFSDWSAAQLESASLEDVLYLARALARLRAAAPPPWAAAFAAAALSRLPSAAPAHHAPLIAAVPSLGGAAAQPALAGALLEAARRALPEYSPPMLCKVLDGVHVMRAVPNEPWVSDCVAAVWEKLPAHKAGHLVSALGSLARLRARPPAAFVEAVAAEAEVRIRFMSAQRLVDVLWALVALNHRPAAAWMASWEARGVEVGLSVLPGKQLARMVWCVAAAQRRPRTAWVKEFFEAAGEKLPELEPASMSDMLWACAMLEEQPAKQWMDGFLEASKQVLGGFAPHHLVTLLWSLALMQHRPPADWLERCMPVLHSHLVAGVGKPADGAASSGDSGALLAPTNQQQQQQGVQAAALPRLAWSLASLSCSPPRPTLEALVARAASDGALLRDADAVAELVWSLDRLDQAPGQPLVAAVTAAARRCLMLAAVAPSSGAGAADGGGAGAAPVAADSAAARPAWSGGGVVSRMLLARPVRLPSASRR